MTTDATLPTCTADACTNTADLMTCEDCGTLVCPDHAETDEHSERAWCQPCAQPLLEAQEAREEQEAADQALDRRLSLFMGQPAPLGYTGSLDLLALVEAEVLKRSWGRGYSRALGRRLDPDGQRTDLGLAMITAPARARAQALVQLLDQVGA